MPEIRNVLLVTNTATDDEITQVRDAFTKVKEDGMIIKLMIAHVIPSLPACYFNMPSMVKLAERYYEEATQALGAVGNLLEVSKKDQWLITGKIRSEVLRLANRLETHFILAGKECIRELHQSFLPQGKARITPVRSINSLSVPLFI